MKAYRSNIEKESCTPTSSNCVVWQGPDIPCLNLCKGDSISDVTYKLAIEVCDLIDNIGISGVDLSKLLEVCQTSPQPSITLANILQLLSDKIVCLSDIVDAIPPPGNNYSEPLLDLTACLQASGSGITQLQHSQYTLTIATKLCDVYYSLQDLSAQVLQNTSDIQDLISNPYTLPNQASCLLQAASPIDIILQTLESEFCDYTEILGPTSDINTALSKQCENLGAQPQLVDSKKTMSLYPGWASAPQNLAQSIKNLWITVCDIRAAVTTIKNNCCNVDCNTATIDFTYKWVDGNTLKLYFFPLSSLPIGFYDCGDTGSADPGKGNMITLTDGNGASYPVFIHFRYSDPTNLTGALDNVDTLQYGYVIDLTDNQLDVATGITIDGNLCFTDGTTSCLKCLNKYIVPYYSKECCTITNSSNNNVTLTYKVCQTTTTTTTVGNL
jgi:hypothetical protein